jgi:NADPH-dependent glutamate synthase beta subunit-like oxidoreductase
MEEKVYDASLFRVCEQCGCCSSACPLTGKDGFNIRRIIRHLELDLAEEVTRSHLPWFCTTCGRCEDACPNGIKILDLVRYVRSRSPAIPESAPCVEACPVHIDIPEYVRLIAEGKRDEAYGVIRQKVPFPAILGRVCTRFCEEKCRRKEVNGAVSICALKRYAADCRDRTGEQVRTAAPGTGKKVAVVGAGPAGLTAAFYLRQKGHEVTLFEEREEAGGMMRFSIPAYRLPPDVLRREIQDVLDAGIELRTGKRLGRDFDLASLKNDYAAVFVSTGAQLSRRISLLGADLDGVLWGLDFLFAVKENRVTTVKNKVVVIGGGNVAIDVALTALRLGAERVVLACLETFEKMPANRWEIDQAVEEGITIMTSWGPERVIGTGSVSAVELVRCTSAFDEEGKFNPIYDTDTKTTIDTSQVILAVGQASDLSFNSRETEPIPVEAGLLAADPDTQATGIEGVFAGGDVAKAPGTIIEAIAAGRKAASAIDIYLGGNGVLSGSAVERVGRIISERREKGFADRKRIEPIRIPVEERKETFHEVEATFEEAEAVREGSRCFGCDLEIERCRQRRLL